VEKLYNQDIVATLLELRFEPRLDKNTRKGLLAFLGIRPSPLWPDEALFAAIRHIGGGKGISHRNVVLLARVFRISSRWLTDRNPRLAPVWQVLSRRHVCGKKRYEWHRYAQTFSSRKEAFAYTKEALGHFGVDKVKVVRSVWTRKRKNRTEAGKKSAGKA